MLVAGYDLSYDPRSFMEIINPKTWVHPKGYNNAIRTRAGRLIFIAGQIAWDEQQRLVGSGNMAAQFDQALGNVITVLKAAGGQPEHVVKLTMYVTDTQAYGDQQAEIGGSYRARMGTHFPAITLVEVKSLYEDEAMIEIEAIAVLE